MALPLGERLDWTAAERPRLLSLRGSHVLVRPIVPDADAAPLFALSHEPAGDPAIWTYLLDGPYESAADLHAKLTQAGASNDALYFALSAGTGELPDGVASYLRITPEHGVIEIGHIWFGVPLRRTIAATEAIYLLVRHAFEDLGYRRVEWKCNALNAPSRSSAERFGFTFEGVFAKHMVVKGRNRDTAWYAITEDEWPLIARGYRAWLEPSNFNGEGCQRETLRELIDESRRK